MLPTSVSVSLSKKKFYIKLVLYFIIRFIGLSQKSASKKKIIVLVPLISGTVQQK